MATLQSRLSDLISAIGVDIKDLFQINSITTGASPNPPGAANRNMHIMSALGVAVTYGIPGGGTIVDGNALIISLKDNGNAKGITWHAIYRSLDTVNVPLPTTTVAGKWMHLGFIYNGADTKWDLISVRNQT